MSRGSPRWQIYCFPRRLQLRYGAGIACNAHLLPGDTIIPNNLTKPFPLNLSEFVVASKRAQKRKAEAKAEGKKPTRPLQRSRERFIAYARLRTR